MHQLLISLFIFAVGLPAYSQAGVCTEDTIKKGHIPLSEDTFRAPPFRREIPLTPLYATREDPKVFAIPALNRLSSCRNYQIRSCHGCRV